MEEITVVIAAYNDELHLTECITSAQYLTDSIVVVDLESSDQTAAVSQKAGARVISHPHVPYVEPTRVFSIEKANSEWVFILDPDERITSELAKEIKVTLKNTSFTHFKIPRKNMFAGKKWLKHGGWWPDYQIRLIKKSAFKDWPKQIHSTPQLEGEMGFFTSPFLHLLHGDFAKMVDKTLVFEDMESHLLYKAGKRASEAIFFRKYAGELIRRLVKGAGFLDGKLGIIEGIYQAYSKTVTYLMLYEKQHHFGQKQKKSSSLRSVS